MFDPKCGSISNTKEFVESGSHALNGSNGPFEHPISQLTNHVGSEALSSSPSKPSASPSFCPPDKVQDGHVTVSPPGHVAAEALDSLSQKSDAAHVQDASGLACGSSTPAKCGLAAKGDVHSCYPTMQPNVDQTSARSSLHLTHGEVATGSIQSHVNFPATRIVSLIGAAQGMGKLKNTVSVDNMGDRQDTGQPITEVSAQDSMLNRELRDEEKIGRAHV